MSRPKQNYIPLNELATWCRAEQIQSRSQYRVWWHLYEPKMVPKAPQRVYEDWKGWSAFLGTNNVFKNAKPHQYKSFDEALVYAHASGISGAVAWMEYKDHPDDIPVRPDFVYRGWFKGWKSFLGTGKLAQAHQIAAAQVPRELGVVVFVNPSDAPGNIVMVFVASSKESAVVRCKGERLRPIKMFEMEEGYDWRAVANRMGSVYDEDQWIVSNVDEMIWEYSNDLMMVRW